MVRGAARLDLSQIDSLSQRESQIAEKTQQKLDFLRKLRDYQRQQKAKLILRDGIASFRVSFSLLSLVQ